MRTNTFQENNHPNENHDEEGSEKEKKTNLKQKENTNESSKTRFLNLEKPNLNAKGGTVRPASGGY